MNNPIRAQNTLNLTFNEFGYYERPIKTRQLPPATKLGQGYIFTGVCDSVNGVCLSACWDPPRSRHPPRADTPPPVQSMLGDMVNVRVVRILLECNLVFSMLKYSPVWEILDPAMGLGVVFYFRSCQTSGGNRYYPSLTICQFSQLTTTKQ